MTRDPGLLERHLRLAHRADLEPDTLDRAAAAGPDALDALHARAHGYTAPTEEDTA